MSAHATTQTAFWNHYTIYNTHRQDIQDQSKKSEKRRRTNRITFRLLPTERAALERAATQAGMSLGEFIRISALHRAHHTNVDTAAATNTIASEDQR